MMRPIAKSFFFLNRDGHIASFEPRPLHPLARPRLMASRTLTASSPGGVAATARSTDSTV
jgi:hypothetical protein